MACPFALLLPLTGPGPRLLSFAVGAFVLGVGVAVGDVVVGTFRQTYRPPALLGRVSSASMATHQGTISPVGRTRELPRAAVPAAEAGSPRQFGGAAHRPADTFTVDRPSRRRR